MQNNIILSAAAAIIESRDFCGDEVAALRQWQDDNRRLTEQERLLVAEEVEDQWGEIRRQVRFESI